MLHKYEGSRRDVCQHVRDKINFTLQPSDLCQKKYAWGLRPSGMLRSVRFCSWVKGQAFEEDCFTLEMGPIKLSRNVGILVSIYAA